MIGKHDRMNFLELARAFLKGDVVLVEVQRVADKETVSAICAIGYVDGVYHVTPFATLIEGDPFRLFRPPNPNGGFHHEGDGG